MVDIILDLFGGDNAPSALVKSAVKALDSFEDITLTFVGDENEINKGLEDCNNHNDRIKIVNADAVLTNNDNPVLAATKAKDYSINKAVEELKSCDRDSCMISVGNTGAILMLSMIEIGLLPNSTKPALASIFPCYNGGFVCMLDCGANLEPTDKDLVNFATLGADCIKKFASKNNPKVALLSVGKEDSKGTATMQSTFKMLKESELNFAGNIEPDDIFSGEIDVVVCNGLVGNMILKNSESVGKGIVKKISDTILNNANEELKKAFLENIDSIRKYYSFNEFAGAIVLGVNKNIIKAHGKANEETIYNCILQAYSLIKDDVSPYI